MKKIEYIVDNAWDVVKFISEHLLPEQQIVAASYYTLTNSLTIRFLHCKILYLEPNDVVEENTEEGFKVVRWESRIFK